jgi:hypothetical protein
MKTIIISLIMILSSTQIFAEAELIPTIIKCKKPDSASFLTQGKLDAQTDLKKGFFRIEVYGELATHPDAYSQILSKDGIELIVTAGCLVNEQILDHAKGYNAVMREAIQKKLGSDYFKKARKKAQKLENKVLGKESK